MENPIKLDDLGVPLFSETPLYQQYPTQPPQTVPPIGPGGSPSFEGFACSTRGRGGGPAFQVQDGPKNKF